MKLNAINIGHALISASSCGIVITGMSAFPKVGLAIQLGGVIGYFITHLFGKKNDAYTRNFPIKKG